MTTMSTEAENDPTADNREEYSVPPATEESPTYLIFDLDGYEIEDAEVPETTYDSDGFEVSEGDGSEVIEGVDPLAS